MDSEKSIKETSNEPVPEASPDENTPLDEQIDIDVEKANLSDVKLKHDDVPKDESIKDESHSNASHTSAEDDLNDSLADEMDVSDVSSSFAENEESKTPSPRKKPKKRQPPIMIGYRKRRKAHSKKIDDDDKSKHDNDGETEPSDEKSLDESKLSQSPASSIDSERSIRSTRKFSGTYSEVTCTDKYCWICHKDGGSAFKCIACPRIYHPKCLMQNTYEPVDDGNFHCPECSAILKADNVNTRSPVMQTVNLDQLCTLLKHIISIMKIQKDAHYFFGPVDTKEFPHYREYVVYPMDISVLENNCKNKMYGCTEAFLADVKWIVHNSIVFNSKAAKITNVAKNLLKICKREVAEIETCAECYYNLLVRKDTWFIEVCKKPHLLVWARLKGYPFWPAKALKCKDGQVDCRFFGAHDKAWVPLKDCYLYSRVAPQPVKVKKGSHLEEGIQEIQKHIKKLQDKYGIFMYPSHRVLYNPAEELEQLQMMLPNYNPKVNTSTKYLIHPDRIKSHVQPKNLFDTPKTSSEESDSKLEPLDEPVDAPSENDESQTKPNTDAVSDNAEITEQKTPSENATVEKCTAVPEKTRDTDTEAEESDSSRSTVTSVKSTSENEPKRNLIVKRIETINATVKPSAVSKPVINATKPDNVVVMPITTIVSRPEQVTVGQIVAKVADKKIEIVRTLRTDDKSKPKAVINVKNFTEKDVSSSDTNSKNNSEINQDFDLDKVKEEPVEATDDQMELTVSESAKSSKSLLTAVSRKRSMAEEDAVEAKKSKNDACRTVNITENVTLSLINNQTNANEQAKTRPAVKKPPTKTYPVNRTDQSDSINGFAAKPVRIAPAPAPKKFTAPSRVCNGTPVNGTMPRSNVVVVQPPRPVVKSQNGIGGILDECMAESNFRKAFEETLDKVAGKGDLRARIILLQKEIENMKKNQELVIDEIKRDYEVQIAELRAASIAQKKFDLASERLKFEQEKERAVREAKSKQWCSNCQKIANYYCCWNTAYCDFECQKEHWNQHMHVCKNDVKKKTAESSENEPPRIMMQNEISNNYTLLNGYDKPNAATYTFQNSNTGTISRNSVGKVQMKNTTNTKTAQRPLLPRVTATVTCSPSIISSTPMVTATFVDNSFQSVNTSIAPLRSTMIGSVNVHPFVRQTQQFHK